MTEANSSGEKRSPADVPAAARGETSRERLNNYIRFLQQRVDRAKWEIRDFAESLEHTPLKAFQDGFRVVEAAAVVHVWEQLYMDLGQALARGVNQDGLYANQVVLTLTSELNRVVRDKAKALPRVGGTQLHQAAASCELAAYAEALDVLTSPLSPIVS